MAALPDWMRPPRAEGWFAEDLDRLPEAPRHIELIDGALVLRVSPQRSWHGRVVTGLTLELMNQAPDGYEVERDMTIKLDRRNRPEPDLLVTTASLERDRTWFAPEDVALVVEVASPESEHRDTTVKLRKYAEAGIRHYWLVEDEAVQTVVHVYELDEPTRAYVPTGLCRGKLTVTVPFPITVDLDGLFPAKR
ncbi:Uma2 family endonuclease [Lentzea sp. DG1S-22]|uniref:Uma2 family endonuclease n=1 Tax=Lentzea sp. DG1S-22 TaxID=3108822 RepID=UPI002E7A2FEE|nr:Uma2 family endonuclease [Lentzea sp. DG1S-22]WVH78140.1 Uma2 family endonuclease [Lentzea sp. DG1S-22]